MKLNKNALFLKTEGKKNSLYVMYAHCLHYGLCRRQQSQTHAASYSLRCYLCQLHYSQLLIQSFLLQFYVIRVATLHNYVCIIATMKKYIYVCITARYLRAFH